MAMITKFDTYTLDELERMAYSMQNQLAIEIFKRYRNKTELVNISAEQKALRAALDKFNAYGE